MKPFLAMTTMNVLLIVVIRLQDVYTFLYHTMITMLAHMMVVALLREYGIWMLYVTIMTLALPTLVIPKLDVFTLPYLVTTTVIVPLTLVALYPVVNTPL
jgi:hypothetical protein